MAIAMKLFLALFAFSFITFYQVEAIKCHVCNSADHKGSCDSSVEGEAFLKDCDSEMDNTFGEFKYCRMYTQKVEGTYRYSRSCAVQQENNRDSSGCVYRSGTRDIFLTICTCDTDGCNSARSLLSMSLTTIVMVAAAALFMGGARH